ncbi:MAG: hypothetical protein ACK5UY_08615 [Holosporales bacterium]
MPDQQGSTWSPEVVAKQFVRKGGNAIGVRSVKDIEQALRAFKESGNDDYTVLRNINKRIQNGILQELTDAARPLRIYNTNGGLFGYFERQRDAGNDVLSDILERAGSEKEGGFFDVTRRVLQNLAHAEKEPNIDDFIRQFGVLAQELAKVDLKTPEQATKLEGMAGKIMTVVANYYSVNRD